MSKVTSKLQVTVPKAVADRYGIKPGDELEWIGAGETIRVVPVTRRRTRGGARQRLALFDQATARQRQRNAAAEQPRPGSARGWRREDLYGRGGAG